MPLQAIEIDVRGRFGPCGKWWVKNGLGHPLIEILTARSLKRKSLSKSCILTLQL